ncbi:MAG: hypothetical protein ACRD3S_20155 [Terracidiphilus sp.]
MKTLKASQATAAAILVFAAVASSSAQTRNWTMHNYPADRFSILLPSDPQIQTQNDPAGPSQMRSYMVDLGQGTAGVQIIRMGPGGWSKDPDTVLQDGKNGALAQTKTHLVSEKKIALDGAPGLEFESENGTVHFRARIYIVGKAAYTVVEAYVIGKPFDHATEFLDSFKLIAGEPAASQK